MNDCTQAIELLASTRPRPCMADKGYDSDTIVEHVEASGAKAVIPPETQPQGATRVRQRPLQTTQSHRTMLQQTQVFPKVRNTIRKIKSLFQSFRSPRLRLVAPEAICRYGLGLSPFTTCHLPTPRCERMVQMPLIPIRCQPSRADDTVAHTIRMTRRFEFIVITARCFASSFKVT